MDSPLISVIIPVYNTAPFLSDSLDSVLNQTYQNFQIVIVNDGSTDDSPRIAERYAAEDPRITVLHQSNNGLSAARNAGLRTMTGDYVAFLDADDVFLPDKLERQLAFLEANPEFDLVYSDYFISDQRLNHLRLWRTGPPKIRLSELYVFMNVFPIHSPLVRAALICRVGEFNEELPASEDWDFWYRASRIGSFGYLPGAVCSYRHHPGQMHRNYPRMRESYALNIRNNFRHDPKLYALALASLYLSDAKHYSRRLNPFMFLWSVGCAFWTAKNPGRMMRIIWCKLQ